ncbi:MAG: hypothetical protein ACYTGQ_16420, partial [Planctomycetota bacterium]
MTLHPLAVVVIGLLAGFVGCDAKPTQDEDPKETQTALSEAVEVPRHKRQVFGVNPVGVTYYTTEWMLNDAMLTRSEPA